MDHYENPRNVGSLDKNAKNVGTGLVGAPACGDVMKLQVSLFRLLHFYLYITIYISDFLLWTCLTDSGGREWQDSRRQIQNIWLWLSHCFQLTGHRVGEGKSVSHCDSDHCINSVWSDYLIVLHICSLKHSYQHFNVLFLCPDWWSPENQKHWDCQRTFFTTSQTSLL